MLRRVAFKPKAPPMRPAKQWDGPAPSPRTPALRVEDGKARACVPIPKPEKTRPGKRTPTKAEAEWMDAIVSYGCVACRIDGGGIVAPQVHHMLRGGRRIGHLFTLPLCPGHHQDDGSGLVARHPWKVRFESKYGTEAFLLDVLQAAIGVTQ